MKKRILSLFLALTLCLTLLPTAAFAEGETGGDGGTKNGSVAKVGDTEYDTLDEILNEMEPAEITLLRDVEAEDTLEVYAATTIHMNGFSITGDIEANDSLTLENGTVKGNVKVDGGTLDMTAPSDAEAAIGSGLNVVSGSCSVRGAKVGVKGTLYFGSDNMTITGTDKAVELTAAAEPSSKKLYGSTDADGETAEEATFVDGTYQVSGVVAKKLSSKQEGSTVTPEPSDPPLILSPTEMTINAGETVTFTAAYTGTGALNAYIQKNGQDENFTVTCAKSGENTYTISVETRAEIFTGTYTLYVHEAGDASVQAKAAIHITGLTPVAEVKCVKYTLLTKAIAAAEDGDTVTLLADHTTTWSDVDAGDESMAVVKKTLTLDLNGKTVDYLVVGEVVPDEEGGILESTEGNLTITDSGLGSVGTVSSLQLEKGKLTIEGGEIGDKGDSGSFVCSDENGEVNIKGGVVWYFGCEGGTANITGGKVFALSMGGSQTVVNISGGTNHGGWNDDTKYDTSTWSVNGGTLNITGGTFGKVLFNYTGGNVDISDGTFQSISNSGASASAPVASLLADECAFYGKDTDGQYTVLKDGTETSLTDVTVKEHTHNVVNGACGCGLQFEAMITDVENNSKLYTKLADAAETMQDGETLTLLADVDVSGISGGLVFGLYGYNNATIDLNSHRLYSTATSGSDPILTIDADGANVTLKNGTIEASENQNGIDAIYVRMPDGHLTLEKITAKADGARLTEAVYLEGGGMTATIVSGDYQGLNVDSTVTAVLKGGTFRPYKKQDGSAGYSIYHRLSYGGDSSRDCMDLLAEGYVYVDEDGEQVRTYGAFDYTVKVQSGKDETAAVAKIGTTKYPSLREAIKAVQNGETIELLQSLDLGDGVVQLEDIDKNFTIDLGNNELKANAQCLVYMMEGNGHVTIQNGTLDGSSRTYYTIFVCGGYFGDLPKLTLKNVKAIGNSGYPVVQVVTNGTVEFDGGTYTGGVMIEAAGNAVLKRGTFAKGGNSYSIQTKASGKTLSNYLDVESLFWNGDTLLNLSSETQTADEVTVRPCTHNWVDGKCTICKKDCDHGAAKDGSMPAEKCPTCGMKAAAGVVIDASEKYFLTFDKALACAAQNNGCTLKLLANVVDVIVTTEKPFIFDLNGHTVHRLTVNSKITLKDSSGGSGQIVENLIVEVKGMSVGELLEEGYAFRSCLDGSWPVATVQTVGNVSILPAPIKSVTAENPSVTVEYGKTAEVTLKATVVPSAEEDTGVSCQWRTGGGTMPKIEGATGSTYQLPADLSAGEHTFYLIATKDGYEKSCEFTVTVKKADLRNAEIAFPYGNVLPVNPVGATGVPTFTVTCNGKKLEQFEDFEITSGGTFDGVGPCTLTVTAKENSNYTGSVSAEWKVRPLKIAVSGANIVKAYDGTTDLPTDAALTFKSVDDMYTGVTFGLSKGTDYQLLDASYASADAGEEKTVSFTVKLLEQGYVFADGTNETSLALKGSTVKINKAAAPSMSTLWQELHVFNDLAKTYEIELETFLPKRTQPCEYGTVTYGALSVTFTDTAYKGGDATLTNGVLRLPIKAASSAKSEIGTLTVEVSSTNYQTFTLTLHIIADDKIVLNQEDVTVSVTDITYGQTLAGSKLTVTGAMKCPRTKKEIKGTFAWTDKDLKPDAAGDYTAEWTFTPAAGYEEYAPATGTVTVKVNRADPVFTAPTAKTLTYNRTAQTLLTASTTQGGRMVYRLGDSGEFIDSIPTGKDAGTYIVYYKVVGDSNHNDTEEQSITVTIDPMKLSPFVLGIDSLTKAYDGTALASLDKDEIEFRSNGAIVLLPEDAYDITNARFTMLADGSYKDSPEAGDGKSLSFTVTLKSDNYVFEGNEGSKTLDCNIYTGEAKSFTITKATAPAAETGTLTITNGLHKTYSLNLSTLLPKLTAPCEYGTITYGEPAAALDGGTFVTRVNSTTGALTLEVSNRNSDTAGAVGTITVPVTTMNYETFNLIINVSAENKATPVLAGELTLTPAEITYGEPLSKITITGTMKDPTTGATVEGTFSWQQPGDTILNASTLGHDVGWKFTPKDGNAYTEATGTATVKVDKAVQYGEPSMSDYTYGEEPSTPTMLKQTGDPNASVTYYYSVADSGSVQTWDIKNPPVLNAGTYRMLARIGYTDNYYQYETGYCEFVVAKATPAYTAPTGLTAKYGQMLADVELPSGWNWENGSTPVGGASATAKTFKATFTPDDPVNYKTVSGIDVELLVNKAEGRNLYSTEQSQKYTDNQEHLFEPDWSDLPEGQNWIFGSTYRRGEGSKVHISRLENNLSGSKLIYALDSGKAGETVDLILTANCGNYEAFTITLRVTLTDRDEQTALRITGADTVVYGQTLALGVTGGSGTGAVTYAVTNGTGEASIEADTGVLTPVKVGTVTVTATKAGDSEYSNVVSAPFTVTITKAASTGEPGYTRITTSGKTLADAELTLTGSTLKPNDGKLEWVDSKGNVLPDDTRVKANTTYKWRFTPTDTNYTTLTGEIKLYHKSSSGGSGGTAAPVITVPVSSDKETVKADASVSNGVATVKVTDRQLEQVATNTDTVTVDLSGLKNVDSAKLPASIVEKSEQSGAELTIALPTGSVTLDATALAAVGNGKDVTVSVQEVALTDAQRDAVGSLAQVAIVVDVNVLTGTAKRSNFNGGKLTVSIPYTLKSGEDPTKLQVWFIRDDGSIENMGGSYDRKTGCFVFSTEHLSCYLLVSTASMQSFADVPASAYYAEAVAWAVKNGITGGTSATTFDPNGFCTRAQAMTFLWRAAGSPTPKSTAMPFTDVPAGSYYYDAVLWAIENDITKGTSDTTFSPNANCSRGQIVTFLWRSRKSPDAAAVNPFTDVVIGAYYYDAVLWAVEKSITGGTSTTTFNPSANCTRAQIVTFIYRCMK